MTWWSPAATDSTSGARKAGRSSAREGSEFTALLGEVTERMRTLVAPVRGALVEPKKTSVAVHYRLVDEHERPRIQAIVESEVGAHSAALRLMEGKMVYEIQPRLEWDKGRAVLYLLEALGLDGDDVVPLYVGDDVTDEDAFRALSGRGIGVLVADPSDAEVASRGTAADFTLRDTHEVERLLNELGPLSMGAQTYTVSEFELVYDGFDPAEEGLRETLTSMGTVTWASAAPRSGSSRTTSITRAPMPTASTTARRRSWPATPSATRTWSSCPTAPACGCASKARI